MAPFINGLIERDLHRPRPFGHSLPGHHRHIPFSRGYLCNCRTYFNAKVYASRASRHNYPFFPDVEFYHRFHPIFTVIGSLPHCMYLIDFLQTIEVASVAKTKKAPRKKTVTARKKVTKDRNTAKSKPAAKKASGKAAAKKKSPSKSTVSSKSKASSRPKSSAGKKAATAQKDLSKDTVTVDRRAASDRRKASDRRVKDEPVAVERRQLQRREKVSRRRQIDPTTCERNYTTDEIEFMNRLEEYKRSSGRMFPTCSEILEVIQGLGYEKRDPAPPETTSDTAADVNPADATSPSTDSAAPVDSSPGVAEPTSVLESPSLVFPPVETTSPSESDLAG